MKTERRVGSRGLGRGLWRSWSAGAASGLALVVVGGFLSVAEGGDDVELRTMTRGASWAGERVRKWRCEDRSWSVVCAVAFSRRVKRADMREDMWVIRIMSGIGLLRARVDVLLVWVISLGFWEM